MNSFSKVILCGLMFASVWSVQAKEEARLEGKNSLLTGEYTQIGVNHYLFRSPTYYVDGEDVPLAGIRSNAGRVCENYGLAYADHLPSKFDEEFAVLLDSNGTFESLSEAAQRLLRYVTCLRPEPTPDREERRDVGICHLYRTGKEFQVTKHTRVLFRSGDEFKALRAIVEFVRQGKCQNRGRCYVTKAIHGDGQVQWLAPLPIPYPVRNFYGNFLPHEWRVYSKEVYEAAKTSGMCTDL